MDKEVRKIAKERMQGHCRVCPQCNGWACSGEVPGMGGIGSGASFRANVESLAKVKLAMSCLHGSVQPDTSTEILGIRLDIPVMAAPIGGVAFNMGDSSQNPVDEAAYADAIILGARNSGIEDATIVATHMVLAAWDAGVDGCWLNFFDPDKMAKELGLPENEEILMLLDLGFAAEGAGPLPNHSSRKPLEQTVVRM